MSNDSEAEETDAVEEDAADEEPESGFQSGEVVKLAYTARTVDEGQLVDTTDEEVAADEGIDTDQQDWGPRTIVLGEGHIFPDVEQDIFGKEVGDEGTVEIAAEDAFGEYEEDQVRTVSKDKIGEDDRYPGAQVQIDGEQGRVETIIGGRARVDFNHPLAGEAVKYDCEDDDEDEESEPEYETVEVEQETLYIEATPQLTMNQQWMMGKQQIAQQLTQLLGVDRIIVQEEIGGGGMGMPGMMGGGMGGLEEQLEDADVDAEEIAEELENAGE